MNSLTDLNRASTQLLSISDNRPPDIVFTVATPSNTSQEKDTTGRARYQPPIDFRTISNARGSWIDFRIDGGICTGSETVLTSGYAYTWTVPGYGINIADIVQKVNFANIRADRFGRITNLTNVGTGGMYVDWGVAELNINGDPISYVGKVFGIKNKSDWDAVKNPVIYSPGNCAVRLVTAYSKHAWNATFPSNASANYGLTIPTVEGNSNVALFSNAGSYGNTYVFTTTQTFYPTATEKTQLCDIVAIGGGGSGYQTANTSGTGGGGGAGEVRMIIGTQLNNTSYTVTIGAGAGVQTRGANTSVVGSTSGNVIASWGGETARDYLPGGGSGEDGGNSDTTTVSIEGNGWVGSSHITANTVARWWHRGGAAASNLLFGAGGGGAVTRGEQAYLNRGGQRGLGLQRNEYDLGLLQRSGFANVAQGGIGLVAPISSTVPGSGGDGSRYPNPRTLGVNGLVLLRFY